MTVGDFDILPVTGGLRRRSGAAIFSIAALTSISGSICLALLISHEPSTKTIEILLGVAAVAALIWRFGLGIWLAILILGSVDALPGPELETIETPLLHLYISDTLIVVLIITLFFYNSRNGFQRLADCRARRVICVWSCLFLLLWLTTVARSYIWADIPLTHAMDFGRDFAFFALLLPLFAATFTHPRVRLVTLLALTTGAIIAEMAEIISVTTHHTLTFLVHAKQTTELNGITRLYVDAQYLAVLTGMLGVGLLLLGQNRRLRLLGALLAALSITSVALELTRAQYVGGTVGLATALVIWLVLNRRSSHFGRQHLARLVLIIVTFVVLVVLVNPPQVSNTAISGVEERFTSVFGSLSSNSAATSTVAYREIEATQLEQILGSHWAFGLGFLDPRNHYVLGTRNGSIRNGDVGVLNAIMTMGIVGAVFIYFPLVFILASLVLRAIAGYEPPNQSWIAFGITAWIVSTLTSSLTLVSLFSSPGLCIAALALGIGMTCFGPVDLNSTRAPDDSQEFTYLPAGNA
jgi:hypothetical protein